MKARHIHQEILISTRSTFAHKSLVEINEENDAASSIEKFTEAIWNGLLNEMLAELMPSTSAKRSAMFNWGIKAGTSYLLVNRSDIPGVTESELSIDPRLILTDMHMN
jgi:hypothetical protein